MEEHNDWEVYQASTMIASTKMRELCGRGSINLANRRFLGSLRCVIVAPSYWRISRPRVIRISGLWVLLNRYHACLLMFAVSVRSLVSEQLRQS